MVGGGKMRKRLLIAGAGTAASQNLLRSLKAAEPDLYVAGCHHDRFVLSLWPGDSSHLVPRLTSPRFPEVLESIIQTEQIALVIPTSDPEVEVVSGVRDQISGACFLPDPAVIELCRDKCETTARLRAAGIRAPETHAVTGLEAVEAVLARGRAREAGGRCARPTRPDDGFACGTRCAGFARRSLRSASISQAGKCSARASGRTVSSFSPIRSSASPTSGRTIFPAE